jgi:23S rRNA maturation mini-RNase III
MAGKILGAAMGSFLALAYIACVVYDLVFRHFFLVKIWGYAS